MSRSREPLKVASVAVFDGDKMLWQRRKDSGKWCLPGGKFEEGEEPLDAAVRELFEETGIEVGPKDMDFLGDDLIESNTYGGLRIYAFRVNYSGDELTAGWDPDSEADKFEWRVDPPKDEDLFVPPEKNVTMRLLGKGPKKPLIKFQAEWRAKDGLRLPRYDTPARKKWDADYYKRLVDVFANGDKSRLRPVKVPVTEHMSGHFVPSGTVGPGGRNRVPFYTRMLHGGDKLPPIVVKRNGQGWHVIDGNARIKAGLSRKIPELDAYELVDPPMKVKKFEDPIGGLAEALVPSLSDDLRKPKYKGSTNPLTGHCYVASEAVWHLLGGAESGWVPQYVKHEGDQHWYLKHKESGKILDLTAGQFKTPVPYEKGIGRGFLTKEPSKRAAELITRIKARQAANNDPLQKGSAIMAGAMLASPMQVDAVKEPVNKMPVAQQQWTTDGLDPDLIPIAHLESSFGKNTKHTPNPKGKYHTAMGALGMKPITGHEEYLKNKVLQDQYPDLKDPAVFMRQLESSPRFYNLVASTHFARLKNLHGSSAKAAYAWRWGHHAAIHASPEQMNNDMYVQKYRHLATQSGLVKSIASLKPGKELEAKGVEPGTQYFDYTHMLGSPVLKKNYKLMLVQATDPYGDNHHRIRSKMFYKNPGLSDAQKADWTEWEPIGYVNLNHEDGTITPSLSHLNIKHRGRGLGKAMYLAAFKHSQHMLHAHTIEGEEHSSMANKVHTAIARDHGLKYSARKLGPEKGKYDNAYGEYQYKLK